VVNPWKLSAAGYGTRDLLVSNEGFTTGTNFEFPIIIWWQMEGSKKYLTPFKDVIMSFYVGFKLYLSQHGIRKVFTKEECEAIREHIKQNGKLE
jgi:hypothetical protein